MQNTAARELCRVGKYSRITPTLKRLHWLPVEFRIKYKGIDWIKYLQLLFANVSVVIDDTEPVVVYAPVYMKRLADLLTGMPKRTVANYMMWRFVMNRVGNLQQSFLDMRRRYNKALHGTHADRARWRVCVSYVNDNFGMAVGRMFVKDNFDIKAKINAEQMIDNIRESFNDLLSEVPWMDEKTREVAREKAYAITEKIGYPDYIMNNTQLDMDYEEVCIGKPCWKSVKYSFLAKPS
ncbi:Neprilysin-4 [Lamellibrachia satsuma]|nr:Neprilysin-4 [Lamellibrachia satsuma]